MSQESKTRIKGATLASGDKCSKGMKWKVTWWANQGVDRKGDGIQAKGRKKS